MFEVGKDYRIEMLTGAPGETTSFTSKVLEFNFPLLKIEESQGREKIINTASLWFVSAEPG